MKRVGLLLFHLLLLLLLLHLFHLVLLLLLQLPWPFFRRYQARVRPGARWNDDRYLCDICDSNSVGKVIVRPEPKLKLGTTAGSGPVAPKLK